MSSAFPTTFLWGVASAAYQIEGAVDEGGRGLSIWDTFSHSPGKTVATGDVAVDHYHRFRDDVAIMADLGVDAYRFSLAWSRILPTGSGEVNAEGVAFYRRLCEELLAAGITPVATLYHWDLPQILEDRGGWLVADSADWFVEYATAAKRHLGDLIQMWTTHNEPWCTAFLGYGSGQFAPGVADPTSALAAAHHVMVSHHRAVTALRQTEPHPDDSVGIVLNVVPSRPATDDPADRAVADATDLVANRLFLEATLHGKYSDEVRHLHDRFEVDSMIDADDLDRSATGIDYLGVNYYNINRFTHVPDRPAPGEYPGADGAVLASPPTEVTDMGWGIEPEGLAGVLRRVAAAAPGLPLYVTENGAAFADRVGPDGEVDDLDRIAYLRDHIARVGEVIAEGVDVRGYFAWSILDNFEWAEGYSKRFGLVWVDYETLERTVKASGHWYRDFIAAQR